MNHHDDFATELFEDPTPEPRDACESAGSCYPTDENETEMIPGAEPRRVGGRGSARQALRRAVAKLMRPWFLEECETTGSCYPTDENESESVPKPGSGEEPPPKDEPRLELTPRPATMRLVPAFA